MNLTLGKLLIIALAVLAPEITPFEPKQRGDHQEGSVRKEPTLKILKTIPTPTPWFCVTPNINDWYCKGPRPTRTPVPDDE